MRFASKPYTTLTFENQNGVYLNTIAKLSYDEVDCTKLRLNNKGIYSVISMDGTSLQNKTISFDAQHVELNNHEILNEKELYLYSSTSGSSKKFKITVDDSGAITATEV